MLDVAAPALVTWGYASGALAALRAWLEGAPARRAARRCRWRTGGRLDEAPPPVHAQAAARSPITWVPSLYFVQGLPFFIGQR